jgi:hypothetical protein
LLRCFWKRELRVVITVKSGSAQSDNKITKSGNKEILIVFEQA